MAGDAAAGAPQGSGGGSIGDRIAELPTPVKIGAALGGAFLAYKFWKGRTAAPTTDPGTGVPTDLTGSAPGLGGIVGGASGDGTGLGGAPGVGDSVTDTGMAAWVKNALAQFAKMGVSPVLANQTIYDYLNGNPLTNQQTGALNSLLGTLGPPPGDVLPIIGNLPPKATVPKPPITTGKPPVIGPVRRTKTPAELRNIAAHVPTLAAINLNRKNHGMAALTAAQAKAKGIVFRPVSTAAKPVTHLMPIANN